MTVRRAVPPPHGALHACHEPVRYEADAHACVLHSLLRGGMVPEQSASWTTDSLEPSFLTQYTLNVWKPVPQAAEQLVRLSCRKLYVAHGSSLQRVPSSSAVGGAHKPAHATVSAAVCTLRFCLYFCEIVW